MDIKVALLKEHSKIQAQKIAVWASQSNANFNTLLDAFLNGDYRLNQRAAWPLGMVGQKYPKRVTPYLGVLINNLTNKGLHDAVKRNTVRLLQDMDVPEEYMGILADVCFGYLADPKEAVAIKVFSMSVLYNITKHYPDMKNELKLLIEEQLHTGSAGFKSRGSKILKALDKLP